MLTESARSIARPLHDRADARPAERAPGFTRVSEAHGLDAAAIDAVLERLPVGVVVADRRGGVVYANEMARRLHLDRAEPVRRALTCALLTGEGVHEDGLELREPNGQRRSFALTVTPIRGADGAAIAAVLTLADVTAARRFRDWEPIVESLLDL